MQNQLVGPSNEVKQILDMFSESTGDYYLFYDFRKDRIYFSQNIQKATDIFALNTTMCTLGEWRQDVDPHDIHRLMKVMSDLTGGKTDHYNLNYRIKNSKGQSCWINSRGKAYYEPDGQIAYVLGRVSKGELTRLPNSFSSEELKREARKILSDLQPGYLLLIGIDDMKTINLKNSRDFGDGLLSDTEQIIRDEVRHRHQVYRVNGDWFAVNLPSFRAEEVLTVFEAIQTRLAGQCTVSGGCVSYTDYHLADEDTLFQYAEISLDHAKTHGKNRIHFFAPEDYEEKLRELELREDLEKSILTEFQGFELYFQPQVLTETYELYGAEALLRYRSPRLGTVSPAEFVPILEQNDLMYPVGLWVIREALRCCRKWRGILPKFRVSINMSYCQLEHDSIVDDVLDLVNGSGVPGSALTIEVTESMQMTNYPQLNSFFRAWKKNGIEMSVDDFGTGYSSLGRLQELAVDEIKIDRSFVRQIQNSAYNYRLLSNIIELANSSQFRVCCEGVETPEELEVLEDMHPFLLQGFLFAEPCSAETFEKEFVLAPVLPWKALAARKNISEKAKAELSSDSSRNAMARTILDAENDIFYLSDLDTNELYYLNSVGQRIFGVKDYVGKKCYKVLHGKDAPCSFCTNLLLRQDSFYVWEQENEYCGRRFLIKDKIVRYNGKKVRLEVLLDITKQEYVSQTTKERLAFAGKIVDCISMLSAHTDYSEAVSRVLASVGEFYQADRAHLFERRPGREDIWQNTFEWCAVNVTSQKENLQNVSQDELSRWMDCFEQEESIIILNISALEKTDPGEWRVLEAQGIQRLIAVPLRDNGKTIGFVGVDNPRYCIHDDSQIRVLVSFLLTRIRQDRNEQKYHILLQESNQDLLQALHVGFWTLEAWKNDGVYEMVMDDTMKQLLAIPEFTSAQDCWNFWFSRIEEEDVQHVKDAFAEIARTSGVVQVEYFWRHEQEGRIRLRLTGLQVEDGSACRKIKGYCRRIDESGTLPAPIGL